MRKILRELRVELIALGVIALGVFLLVEQLDIRVTIYRWFKQSSKWMASILDSVQGFFTDYLRTFTLSDAVGLFLVLVTLVFIGWRFRWRFMRSKYYLADECPNCGGKLDRVHRTRMDKVLEFVMVLKFHRYRCADHCGWEGLRKPIHSGKRAKS